MKQKIKFAANLVLIWLVLVISCKKDRAISSGTSSNSNRAPIARAGADTSVTLAACYDNNFVLELNGNASSDPDNSILYYTWIKVSGPDGIVLSGQYSPNLRITNFVKGEYIFQLTVTNTKGLISKDQVSVSVKAVLSPYDLDILLNGSFNFTDNLEDCYYYYPCSYYDFTQIQAHGFFHPLGDFTAWISEYSDTAMLDNSHDTYIHMYINNVNNSYVSGTSSVNFKKLIRDGGGPFNGTFQVTSGSAATCDNNVLNNLSPLTIDGSLDIVTKRVTLTIRGKIYF